MPTLRDPDSPYWLHIVRLVDQTVIEVGQGNYTDSDRGIHIRHGDKSRDYYPWARVARVQSFLTTDAEQHDRYWPSPDVAEVDVC